MVRIHVIYCGGCREAYDRGEWLESLKGMLRTRINEGVELCYSPCEDARLRLIMFGCLAACLNPEPWERHPGVPEHSIGPGGYFDGRLLEFEEIADILAKEIQGAM